MRSGPFAFFVDIHHELQKNLSGSRSRKVSGLKCTTWLSKEINLCKLSIIVTYLLHNRYYSQVHKNGYLWINASEHHGKRPLEHIKYD